MYSDVLILILSVPRSSTHTGLLSSSLRRLLFSKFTLRCRKQSYLYALTRGKTRDLLKRIGEIAKIFGNFWRGERGMKGKKKKKRKELRQTLVLVDLERFFLEFRTFLWYNRRRETRYRMAGRDYGESQVGRAGPRATLYSSRPCAFSQRREEYVSLLFLPTILLLLSSLPAEFFLCKSE